MALVDVGADEQQGGLGEAAAAFVHGHGGHVRPRLHGGDGHVFPEVEVGAVGLVGQAVHAGVVGHLHNGLQVAANAVVGGVVHQHRHGVRVLPDGLGHLLPLHAQGDAQLVVHLGVDVDGDGAAQHQGVDDAAVDVAGHDDLVPPLAGGQHHGLHGTGGAAHHQKGVGGAEGVGGQLLGLANHRDGMAQVVQGLHAVDVDAHALLAQKLGELRVAPAPLVAGDVKGHHPHLAEGLEGLVNGGLTLVKDVFSLHMPHLDTKKDTSCICTACVKQGQYGKARVPTDPSPERAGERVRRPANRDDKKGGGGGLVHRVYIATRYFYYSVIDRFTSLRKCAFRL